MMAGRTYISIRNEGSSGPIIGKPYRPSFHRAAQRTFRVERPGYGISDIRVGVGFLLLLLWA